MCIHRNAPSYERNRVYMRYTKEAYKFSGGQTNDVTPANKCTRNGFPRPDGTTTNGPRWNTIHFGLGGYVLQVHKTIRVKMNHDNSDTERN